VPQLRHESRLYVSADFLMEDVMDPQVETLMEGGTRAGYTNLFWRRWRQRKSSFHSPPLASVA